MLTPERPMKPSGKCPTCQKEYYLTAEEKQLKAIFGQDPNCRDCNTIWNQKHKS